jgi:hypothetical protein
MNAASLDSFTTINSLLDSSESPHLYLDWTQRPENIELKVSEAFKNVKDEEFPWGYNGSSKYEMGYLKEHALLKTIISQAPAGQKDFYILDIGAGDFQWGQSLAKFIEEQTDLPKDIKVHIISVRGEKYLGDRIIETDRCKIYNLGAFKVEELFAEFKKEGLDLENKIDLCVSRWTFRHLVDPVGTFLQVYRLLRGYFLFDGFCFVYGEEGARKSYTNGNHQMTQLLSDTGTPFLTTSFNTGRSLNHFILQKPNLNPCQLPMSYKDVVEVDKGTYIIGSGCMTAFKREPQETDSAELCLPRYDTDYVGDKKLYDWLKTNELFNEPDTEWKPLNGIT